MPGVDATMHEWKAGSLHSGSKSGPIVHSREQAIAIALNSEDGGTGKNNHGTGAHSTGIHSATNGKHL